MSQSPYERVYAIVRRIPKGRVMTYGGIARQVRGCTARMVGYALAAIPDHLDLPWFRVVNRLGEISPRRDPAAESIQRQLLEAEGVVFDERGRIDLQQAGVDGISRRQGSGLRHSR